MPTLCVPRLRPGVQHFSRSRGPGSGNHIQELTFGPKGVRCYKVSLLWGHSLDFSHIQESFLKSQFIKAFTQISQYLALAQVRSAPFGIRAEHSVRSEALSFPRWPPGCLHSGFQPVIPPNHLYRTFNICQIPGSALGFLYCFIAPSTHLRALLSLFGASGSSRYILHLPGLSLGHRSSLAGHSWQLLLIYFSILNVESTYLVQKKVWLFLL